MAQEEGESCWSWEAAGICHTLMMALFAQLMSEEMAIAQAWVGLTLPGCISGWASYSFPLAVILNMIKMRSI